MKVLANPLFLRMAVVFMVSAAAFFAGLILIRRLRHGLAAEAVLDEEPSLEESLPLHAFQTVIQELKQQKFELQNQHEIARRRNKATEHLNAAVLGHLSSGVMLLGANGLVRQANTAAKQILGYASPIGLRAEDIFREAVLSPASSATGATVVEAVQAAVQQKSPFQRLEVEYSTPGGEPRVLEMTLTSLHAPDGAVLGAACLISDRSEIARIRRQEELRAELSAAMALELRSSLGMISDCARQVAAGGEAGSAQRLAGDIAVEAERLERTVGGFLAGEKTAQSAAV